VTDRVRAVAARGCHEVLDDHRSRERGDQRILTFIERVGAQRGHDEVLGELRARVDHLDLDGARGAGPFVDERGLPRLQLADVDRTRDDLDIPVLAHPPDGDRGVQPARVREHNALRHDFSS
jgi:hypothetical protein